MRKMRKMLASVAVLLVLALASTVMVGPVQADIVSWSWLGSAYTGRDAFYGASYNIYAYEAGSTATLVVTVENDYKVNASSVPINVSLVQVRFDWGVNYNSTQCSRDSPVAMEEDEIRTFHISFTVPGTDIASNRYLHGYKIFIEHVNSTTTPMRVRGNMTKSYLEDPDFAVYSANQTEAQRLSQTLSGMPVPSFNSTSARLLVYKAQNETSVGNENYRRGDFASAKTHYTTALSLYTSAYSAEETRGVKLEDLQVEKLEAEIGNTEAWASMVSSLSTTSVLLGVATVLFGIGYIIKQLGTLKKPVGREVTE